MIFSFVFPYNTLKIDIYKAFQSSGFMGFWPLVNEVLDQADILLLIGDARMPELSNNLELERKVKARSKPLIYVLNKMDLVSEESLKAFTKEYPNSFFVSATQNMGISELRRHIQITGKKLKLDEPVVGVVGYPNIGKSAVINALARRKKTAVADKPGTTRGVQWIKSNGLKILDSPGVIPYEDTSSKLALIGSKAPGNFINPEKVALEIIHLFLGKNKKNLEERYAIEFPILTQPEKILEMIARKRGFLKKGGVIDETKTAIYIIQDWQKGKLKF